MPYKHHLAGVWFADLVGYTRLSQRNEHEAVRLVRAFQRVAREVVDRHGGRIVKFLGDGALAEFRSADDAVRSASALVHSLAVVAEADGLDAGGVRIGVHVGDVVTEGGDLYGDGVNVASRIQAVGSPGEVWVSEDVLHQLRHRPEFRFQPRGEHDLKGLERPLALHSVEVMDETTWTPPDEIVENGKRRSAGRSSGRRRALAFGGAAALIAVLAFATSTWWQGRGGRAAASENTLAILPFENLSGDESTEPFVLGVHDDLLSHLSRIGGIRVISRTSVMGYRGTTKGIPQIAEELGASAVLEGGVQRSGERIRMNVQLIDARTDEHLWAEQFDRTLTVENVFAIQGEIAERIAEALQTALTPEERAGLARAPTSNLEALDLYYQGLDFYRDRSATGLASEMKAEQAFSRATEADPGFAAAWAGLAQLRSWLVRNGAETDTTAARRALDRALTLAPEARETTLAQGVYSYYAKGDFHEAVSHFDAGLRRWPNDSEFLYYRAIVLRREGRWKEALESARKARESDPRNPELVRALAETLHSLGRYDEAERLYDQLLDSASREYRLHLLLFGRGDIARARRFLDAFAGFMSVNEYAELRAKVAFFERDYDAGIEALQNVPFDPHHPERPLLQRAMLAAWASEREAARVWADSLLAVSELLTARHRAAPADPFGQEAKYLMFSGVAHALGGRPVEAVRDGRRGAEIFPLSKDAIEAPSRYVDLVSIYVLVGDRASALAVLDTLASVPSLWMGPGRLRLDPTYNSLRGDPRFDALTRKAETNARTGFGTR